MIFAPQSMDKCPKKVLVREAADSNGKWRSPRALLALNQVCRQVYEETSLLPFSLNTFELVGPNDFLEFNTPLSPQQLNAITTMYIAKPVCGMMIGWKTDSLKSEDSDRLDLLAHTSFIRPVAKILAQLKELQSLGVIILSRVIRSVSYVQVAEEFRG